MHSTISKDLEEIVPAISRQVFPALQESPLFFEWIRTNLLRLRNRPHEKAERKYDKILSWESKIYNIGPKDRISSSFKKLFPLKSSFWQERFPFCIS